MKLMRLMTAVFCLFFAANPAFADVVHLRNGDKITGEIYEQDEISVKLKTELMGVVVINQQDIVHMEEEKKPIPAPVEAPLKTWTHKFASGYQTTKGNNHSRWITGGLNSRYQKGRNEVQIRYDMFYGSDREKMTTQRSYGKLEHDYRFKQGSKWYSTRTMEYAHDRFGNIDYRLIPRVGAGYWISEKPDWTAQLDLSVGYEYSNYREVEKSRGTWVLVPHGFFNRRLIKKLKLIEDISLYPSIAPANSFRWRSETSLVNPLNSYLSWRISFIDEYNSRPLFESKKHDTTFLSSLEFGF
jgi:putative salt-induced outer membrane protein YdiY